MNIGKSTCPRPLLVKVSVLTSGLASHSIIHYSLGLANELLPLRLSNLVNETLTTAGQHLRLIMYLPTAMHAHAAS